MIDAARTAVPGSQPGSVPAGVRRRVQRVLADITAQDGAAPTVRWLTGPSAVAQGESAAGEADVVVAHDVLPHASDAAAARALMAALARRSRRHLIISAPREPLARAGITLAGRLLGGRRPQRFSAPDLLRLASTAGAVRATHLPPLWTVLWVRRT